LEAAESIQEKIDDDEGIAVMMQNSAHSSPTSRRQEWGLRRSPAFGRYNPGLNIVTGRYDPESNMETVSAAASRRQANEAARRRYPFVSDNTSPIITI
jgi:hypothetical protein